MSPKLTLKPKPRPVNPTETDNTAQPSNENIQASPDLKQSSFPTLRDKPQQPHTNSDSQTNVSRQTPTRPIPKTAPKLKSKPSRPVLKDSSAKQATEGVQKPEMPQKKEIEQTSPIHKASQELSETGRIPITRDSDGKSVENTPQSSDTSPSQKPVSAEPFVKPVKRTSNLEALQNTRTEGMDELIEKIWQVSQKTDSTPHIVLAHDADADGITSAAIMKKTLEKMGCEVSLESNHPQKAGHQPTEEQFENIIDRRPDMVIALDWGSQADFSKLTEKGIAVDVVDHHKTEEGVPLHKGLVINATHHGESEENCSLCTAGLAYVMGNALLDKMTSDSAEEEIEKEILKDELIVLAGIGTLVDRVPGSDLNSTIKIEATEALNRETPIFVGELVAVQKDFDEATRPGKKAGKVERLADKPDIKKLMKIASPTFSAAAKSENTSAASAVEMICANAAEETRDIISKARIDIHNLSHDAIETCKEVARVQKDEPIVLLADIPVVCKSIAASAAAEELPGTPVLCFGQANEDGIIRGTTRMEGGPDVSFPALLGRTKEILDDQNPDTSIVHKFGGHDRAAGFTIEGTHMKAFSKAFHQAWSESEWSE